MKLSSLFLMDAKLPAQVRPRSARIGGVSLWLREGRVHVRTHVTHQVEQRIVPVRKAPYVFNVFELVMVATGTDQLQPEVVGRLVDRVVRLNRRPDAVHRDDGISDDVLREWRTARIYADKAPPEVRYTGRIEKCFASRHLDYNNRPTFSPSAIAPSIKSSLEQSPAV